MAQYTGSGPNGPDFIRTGLKGPTFFKMSPSGLNKT